MDEGKRGGFTSKMGIVLATAGSAVGLGNIWRFPYMTGMNGGAAFILIYSVCVLLLGIPGMVAEFVVGRSSQSNAARAYKKLAGSTPWRVIGYLGVVTSMIILGFYAVVAGWCLQYLFASLAGQVQGDAQYVQDYFVTFSSDAIRPVLWGIVFIALTHLVVVRGVRRGIERASKWLMPILLLLLFVLMIASCLLPGAMEGVKFLLMPDFSKLSGSAVASAIGQAFFSLSLGVGTILVYASYMRKEENIFSAGAYTTIADFLFAIIAGFAIMPAVFAAGIEPGAGPGLVFETLPFIFNQMGTAVPWLSATVAILFFLTILVAALTSSISLMEVGVSYIMENTSLGRKTASLMVGALVWVLGIVCSLSFGPLAGIHIGGENLFGALDKLCSNWLMPFGGLLFTIFAGWKMKKADARDEFTNGGTCNRVVFSIVYFLIRYVAPIGIIVVFVTAILGL